VPTWQPVGPRPTTEGQVENIADGEVVGAVKAVAPHPADKNVAFIGSVNGGIWRTANATAPSPSWQCQTDDQKSQSIGAIEFDPTDAGHMTLVAGVGRFSSLGDGGALTGLLRTTNGGATWAVIDGGGTLAGLNVSGVAPRGGTIVISVNAANPAAKEGIWRVSGAGAPWVQVSGAIVSGLPAGPSFDLAGDPTNPNRLYTNAGGSGLFRSDDAGATWSKKSDAAMDGLIAGARNIKFAVGRANNLFVAIVGDSGRLEGVFRSGNHGDAWTGMDLPTIAEGGIHPGGQGQIHLAIAADPTNPQLVYIGGDRQEGDFPNVPNSIGARDFSGILFRGDASRPPGNQWAHLTHSNALGPPGGGTAHGSAPHADSRDLAVDAGGELLLSCDGGVYRRTSPRDNTGDWKSVNGNLQTTEFHAVAYDSNSDTVIGGAQDTGTPEEKVKGGPKWHSVSTGDGGVVAVDATSSPGQSIRYTSDDSLSNFRRQVYDSSNNLVSEVLPALAVVGGGNDPSPQFYTPIRLNTVNPSRLIIGAANSVYESLDKGDTISEIGPGIETNGSGPNPIAYGAAGNPDALYVGARNRVFVRMAASPAGPTASAGYPGGTVVGIAVDPNDPRTAYVIDPSKVYRTTDAGGGWTEITGNLATLSPGKLRSIAYSTNTPGGAVVVGTDAGVVIAAGPAFNSWGLLGAGLPRAPVFHIEYDPKDKIFLAGTLGRGAWTLKP
jgi:hypothetical protein